jgi:hypothetical protein
MAINHNPSRSSQPRESVDKPQPARTDGEELPALSAAMRRRASQAALAAAVRELRTRRRERPWQ